jgi:hypothetical protein
MAVLLGLTALATSLAPRPTVTPREATSSPTPRPSPTPPAASPVIERAIDASAGARAARVRVRAGDVVRLAVRGDAPDAVELEGLGKLEPVEAGSPARFEFLAEKPGEHPIMLLDADRQVGLIDIRAAG